jgi:hypothetical protein
MTSKRMDFNDWCVGVKYIEQNVHLTEERIKLKKLKEGMNRNRKVLNWDHLSAKT